MEYHGTDHGNFIEVIFKKNYKKWFDYCLKLTAQEKFDLNDIDGARNWRQTNTGITIRNYLKAADQFAVYKTKRYPETIERNIDILQKYILLCRHYNVEPIAFILPFSKVARKHYPENSIQEFFSIM